MKHLITIFFCITGGLLPAQDTIYFGIHNTGALLELQQYNRDTLFEDPGLLNEMLLFEYNDSSRIQLLSEGDELRRVLVIPGADSLALSALDELEESSAVAVILSVMDSFAFCQRDDVMASLIALPLPVFVLDSAKVAKIQNFLPSLVSLSRKKEQPLLLDTLLSADRSPDLLQLLLAPNPTADYLSYRLTIEGPARAVEKATVRIISSDAKTVKQFRFNLGESLGDNISVSDLPAGTYRIVISSKSHQLAESFVIAR